PPAAPLPAASRRKRHIDREVAIWPGRWLAVILGHFRNPCKERAFVVLRRWRGDSASTLHPITPCAPAPPTASPPALRALASARPAHPDGAPPRRRGGWRRAPDHHRPGRQRLSEEPAAAVTEGLQPQREPDRDRIRQPGIPSALLRTCRRRRH